MATAATVAASFGYSVTFFNSDPELKKLLNTAVKQNWTPDKFVSMFRSTRWYRTHGEAFREITVLKTTDPATYTQRINNTTTRIAAIAYSIGAQMTPQERNALAQVVLAAGWSDDQIKFSLANKIQRSSTGVYSGGAATVQRQIESMLQQYGYAPSAQQMGTWVTDVSLGRTTLEGVQESVIAQTASKFPSLKDRLLAGETLMDIAAPYIDSYAKILEVNPKTISLRTDSTLMSALQAKDAQGKPTTQTVWQFEQNLRKDKRWLSTKNAQDSLMGNTRQLLEYFGMSAI